MGYAHLLWFVPILTGDGEKMRGFGKSDKRGGRERGEQTFSVSLQFQRMTGKKGGAGEPRTTYPRRTVTKPLHPVRRFISHGGRRPQGCFACQTVRQTAMVRLSDGSPTMAARGEP